MIHVFGIVKNTLAGVACNDLIVAADFLKDLRPDPNLANFANFIPGSCNSNSPAGFADTFVSRDEIIGRNRRLDLLSLF